MIQHPMHPAIRALEETLVSLRNCRNRALQPSNGGSFNQSQSFYSKPPQSNVKPEKPHGIGTKSRHAGPNDVDERCAGVAACSPLRIVRLVCAIGIRTLFNSFGSTAPLVPGPRLIRFVFVTISSVARRAKPITINIRHNSSKLLQNVPMMDVVSLARQSCRIIVDIVVDFRLDIIQCALHLRILTV